ncbi:CLUMA_CG011496, isoform A [Clunio marinus]|uniref:CLUMA_CG011496, isoform A n=1 Tax=Clunio marinus TaxID=568069 RepID=A0A1J1II51_9DIPT|nr:CLUMA_CG011496, isoform A [Clunio marinus]
MFWPEWTDNNYLGLNLRDLKVDESYLNVSNQISQRFCLYSLSEDCVNCPLRKLKQIIPNEDTIVTLEVARNLELRLVKDVCQNYLYQNQSTEGLSWSAKPELGEFGVYTLSINNMIKFEVDLEPVNVYLSLLYVGLLVSIFYWICKAGNKFYKSQFETPQPTQPDNETVALTTQRRLKSLDIFRGIAIVLMIFVNSGGGQYWWIEHAVWNGLHLADLVFPWFLFIMGVCIPLSIRSQINKEISKTNIVKKVIKRSLTLFVLGLFLNTTSGATFETIRIFGVLQRFAVAYLATSLIHLAFVTDTITSETRFQQVFHDIRLIWRQWIVIILLILLHLAVIFSFKAPNCSRGYFGPGGMHDYNQHQNCTGGVIGYIDRMILGENHMYQHAKIRSVYGALVFDPEGVFGCLLTIVQVFFGLQCGVTLLVYPTPKDKLNRWILWSIMLASITAILTFFSVEDGIIPINKNLWSLSFVTITTSLAFLLFSAIYYLVDVKNIGDDFWKIFLYPGMNAIVLYVGHSIFHKMWPFHFSFAVMNTHFLFLLENIYTVIIWIFIARKLYHKKVFLNI